MHADLVVMLNQVSSGPIKIKHAVVEKLDIEHILVYCFVIMPHGLRIQYKSTACDRNKLLQRSGRVFNC